MYLIFHSKTTDGKKIIFEKFAFKMKIGYFDQGYAVLAKTCIFLI